MTPLNHSGALQEQASAGRRVALLGAAALASSLGLLVSRGLLLR